MTAVAATGYQLTGQTTWTFGTLERTFTELMGDKVEPRKAFIERHAKEVRFLDV